MPSSPLYKLQPVAVQSSFAKHIVRRSIPKTCIAIVSAILAAIQFVERTAMKRHPIIVGRKRTAGFLAAVVAAAGLILGYKQQHGKHRSWRDRFVQHPLVAWFLENSSIVAIATLNCTLVPPPRHKSFFSAFGTVLLTSMFQVWAAVGLQSLFVRGVYRDIPFFSDRSYPPAIESLKAFVRTNFQVDLFNSTMLGFNIAALHKQQFSKGWVERRFSPLSTLKKLAVLRICIDVGFWLGHRILHHRKFYWIHKRHHEHKRPTLETNFHFAPVDLWIEAAAPATLGLIVLESLKMPMTRFELSLLSTYFLWHEAGSHCGKPVPTVTYFPPLAPLYQLLLGPVDQYNVKHHDMHHQYLDGNYGITIWPDIIMGTRIPLPDDVQRRRTSPANV